MNPREIKNEIVELRMTEMDVREQLVSFLGEVHRQKLWREYGYKSFADFFAKELGYDKYETRDMLVRLGIILPSSALYSENPDAQERSRNSGRGAGRKQRRGESRHTASSPTDRSSRSRRKTRRRPTN